jgi:predicted phage terminase large subunit-like protein
LVEVKLARLRRLRDLRLATEQRRATGAQRWASPLDMAQTLDPATGRTPALELICRQLVAVAEGRVDRLIVSMPPQEGKSELTSRRFPLWLLHRNPELRIAITSYELGVARRWGRAIRNDLATYAPLLGLTVRADTSAAHEWQLDGHLGGVYSTGVGGALTGRHVDALVIDDPIKDRKQADSPTYRENVWDWWTNVARTRLAPGAPVVVILTRWHGDDLAGRLLRDDAAGAWTVLNIPAYADHDPARSEVDPLGREPGEWMLSVRGRTVAEWERIRREVGSRVFGALYQGRPSPAAGDVFHRGWWRRYDQPQWFEQDDGTRRVVGFDDLLASWDMAFKDTDGADYVVGQVWGRRGARAYLLDQVRGRWGFVETCARLRELSARWPQVAAKVVEDKANGTAVINALASTVPGLIPVEPHGSKTARAAAVSPFVEAGQIYLPAPELAPWVGDLIEECSAFPRAQHDDQVDALSQALNRLYLSPLLDDQVLVDAEDDDYGISAY